MTITDPTAIKFSNERARIAADRLARSYYLCDAARDRWAGLAGSATEKIAIMEADIRRAATEVIDAYAFAFLTEKIWFLGVNNEFPNTTEEVDDGSPGDGRPAGTGAKVQAVMSRVVEFQNWLLSAAGSFADANRTGLAYYNTILMASNYGPPTMSEATASNMINRCDELAANYEASSNANVNSLLAFAVNPQPI